MKKISILLVDDHRLLRESWSDILNNDNRFYVVGSTDSGFEAIEMAERLLPAIIIMDMNMTPVDGFEATRQICESNPQSRIIGLSMYANIFSARRFLNIGAMGYLTKNSSKEEVILAITVVSEGKKYICEEIKNILAYQELKQDKSILLLNSLSKREIEIVQLVKKGFSSKEMALMLGLNQKTIEVHRYNILRKLKVKNSAALVNFCNANGV